MNFDDDDSSRGGSAQPEDGKGKEASSSQVRKAQNRLAQREFRQRKQQYIRDLEARVEVLSGDKEERVELMTLLVRNLLKENKDLRDMIQNMATFLGDGLGSCLPRLGLNAKQLDAILNKADTDTAFDAFISLKASREMEKANPGIIIGDVRRKASVSKRKREGDESVAQDGLGSSHTDFTLTPDGSEGKRVKTSFSPQTHFPHSHQSPAGPSSLPPLQSEPQQQQQQMQQQQHAQTTDYDYLFPDLNAFANASAPRFNNNNNSFSPFNPYTQQPTQLPSSNNLAALTSLPEPGQIPLPIGYTNAPSMFSGFGLTIPGYDGFASMFNPSDFLPPTTTNNASDPRPVLRASTADMTDQERDRHNRLREAVANLTASDRKVLEGAPMTPAELQTRLKVQEKLLSNLPESDQNNRMLEAMQMITYHLNNFRVNRAYVLPPSLRPTKIQRTVAHEHAIDGLIFPSVRDRMILLRGRYDLTEAFLGVIDGFILHGEDPLDHHNWEISERWLKDYDILVNDEVYTITNKWRAQRGEPPLQRLNRAGDLDASLLTQ